MRAPVFAPALAISPEKVCFVALKAREFDVKDAVSDPDSGSNPADDAMLDVLEDHSDDSTFDELTAFIDGLTEDEQIDLVALAWLGRDDNSPNDWPELKHEASRAHNKRTAALIYSACRCCRISSNRPVSMLGLSCEDHEF